MEKTIQNNEREEIKTEIESLNKQNKQLREMLEANVKRLNQLHSILDDKKIEKIEDKKTSGILRILFRVSNEDKWIECGIEDIDKEVEQAKEMYNLDDKLQQELKTLLTSFKQKNNL